MKKTLNILSILGIGVASALIGILYSWGTQGTPTKEKSTTNEQASNSEERNLAIPDDLNLDNEWNSRRKF